MKEAQELNVKVSIDSLNPCYNGIKMKEKSFVKTTIEQLVLILVIME